MSLEIIVVLKTRLEI